MESAVVYTHKLLNICELTVPRDKKNEHNPVTK